MEKRTWYFGIILATVLALAAIDAVSGPSVNPSAVRTVFEQPKSSPGIAPLSEREAKSIAHLEIELSSPAAEEEGKHDWIVWVGLLTFIGACLWALTTYATRWDHERGRW